jgi:hypothetical protein
MNAATCSLKPETEVRTRDVLWLLACLWGLPLLLVIGKQPGCPSADWLLQSVTLLDLTPKLQAKLTHILFIPLGALSIVLIRQTLGLRVLGPFRSILLAVAFQTTGTATGLAFLIATTAIVVGLRPAVQALRLPYFGRITVMLSSVAMLMVLGVMASRWLHNDMLQEIVYLPIVVLCLIADAFARTMNAEGLCSALWRGTITVLAALLLATVSQIPWLSDLFLTYPELLISQVGGIVFISRFLDWRLLERFNPKAIEDEEDNDGKEEVALNLRRLARLSRQVTQSAPMVTRAKVPLAQQTRFATGASKRQARRRRRKVTSS